MNRKQLIGRLQKKDFHLIRHSVGSGILFRVSPRYYTHPEVYQAQHTHITAGKHDNGTERSVLYHMSKGRI